MNVLGISKVPQYAIPRTFFIEMHMSKIRRSETGWVCPKCGFIAEKYQEYLEHYKTIHSHTKCVYCGRLFKQPCSCSEHEKHCEANPNATPSKKRVRKKFNSNDKKYDRLTGHKYAETVCRYCGFPSKYEYSLHFHEKYCKKNPNRCKFPSHCETDETRRKKSISMHIAALEGRNRGWAATRLGENRKSYPEEFFTKIIEQEFLDKKYVYNLPFYTWKLDFAWPEKKRVIEIDGSQHNRLKQQESDQRKDAKLELCGWKVLRIKWVDMYHKPREMINAAKEFIDTGEIIANLYKSTIKVKYYPKCCDIIFKRIHAPNYIPISIWNERRRMILLSGINLHKYGWVDRVSKQTGLSRRVIYHTVQRFGMDVYSREYSQN